MEILGRPIRKENEPISSIFFDVMCNSIERITIETEFVPPSTVDEATIPSCV